MGSMKGEPVDLCIYDLTNGLASVLSPSIIGLRVEGVWHTSIVVFGREFYFGGYGIVDCVPGSTGLGLPRQVLRLGSTSLPRNVFHDYIVGLGATSFTSASYHLLEHNCNHFSEAVAVVTCDGHVPKHVLHQAELLPPNARAALSALLNSLTPVAPPTRGSVLPANARASPDYETLNAQIEEARAESAELQARRRSLADKLARRERRERRKRRQRGPEHEMAEAVGAAGATSAVEPGPGPSTRDLEEEVDMRALEEQRRRVLTPPVIFRDIDAAVVFEAFQKALVGIELVAEEWQTVEELRQYVVQGEGSWVVGDGWAALLARVLGGDAADALLRVLSVVALREDVALLLHADRRSHALLAHAAAVDELPCEQRLAIAYFMCNLFEHSAPAEWLLYISEWRTPGGRTLSNIEVTTKVCVHSLLGAEAELREVGTALLYNIAHKERLGLGAALRRSLGPTARFKVFDDACVELCMAALAWLVAPHARPEEQLWRALAALARLAAHSAQVPRLIAVVGPDPASFRGASPRIDEQIDIIMKKASTVAS